MEAWEAYQMYLGLKLHFGRFKRVLRRNLDVHHKNPASVARVLGALQRAPELRHIIAAHVRVHA